MKSIFIIFSILFCTNAFAGHSIGNGGGVVCMNGVCKTLQEAGLKLSPVYNGVWIPEAQHFSSVKNRVTNLLFVPNKIKESYSYRTFGRVDHFRRVDIVDPAKLEAIKKQYIEIAEEAGVPIDPATFQVVAISSDNTVEPALTYLLPKFFELTTAQQTAILFHEGLYRGRPTKDLKNILQLESAMYQIEKNGRQTSFVVDELILSYQLGMMTKPQFIGTLLSYVAGQADLEGSTYSRLPFKHLGDVEIAEKAGVLILDPQRLLILAEVEPRIPYMFSRVNTIELIYSHTLNENNNCDVIETSWGESGDPYFRKCEWRSDPSTTEFYKIANPEAIELILPE